ncbi:MAG: hypothetical protein BWY58_01670 [Chloroflexi bacterium ADurb.Bin344]|nr:MAG: hypothetical protein BWY58_01670 [Chloroflexi bacterium ADurb.Bin344]
MEKNQRITCAFIILIGLVYFCLLIPANLTGAADPEMLSVFEVDEYAQYPHVIQMLTPGDTLYHSIRNFFIYQHYFYGFPFYFLSAISVFPLKLLSPNWPENTRLIVCWLRMTINVLPMIFAIGIFTWLITRFKNRLISLSLFVFLLTIPAVLLNNFWWHPDSLSLFFISLVFLFLDLDEFRFGKYFSLAAAACGYTVGIKYQGLYFALAIPLLLIYAILRKRLSWKKAIKKAIIFVVIMMVFFIFSNPLLLLPQERAEIIRTQQLQFEQTGVGIFTIHSNALRNSLLLPSDIRKYYAETWFFILAIIGLLMGFKGEEKQRIQSLLFLSYLMVAFCITTYAATNRLHYFLPVAVPLLGFIADFYFIGKRDFPAIDLKFGTNIRKVMYGILTLLIAFQFSLNIRLDHSLYRDQLSRETESSSIALYHQIENEIIPVLKSRVNNRMIRVFRDWKVYFPDQEGVAVQMDWNMATLDKINEWQPDLIILEEENLKEFSDPTIIDHAVNPEEMKLIHSFYQQAASDQIPGYDRIMQNSFGSVYVRVGMRDALKKDCRCEFP